MPPQRDTAGKADGSSSVIDIEELHSEAVSRGQRTYIDPLTGFSVFTELSHLDRGVCCGNQCRHCPYGWSNVPTGQRRKAKVKSGDVEAAHELGQSLQHSATKASGTKNSRVPAQSTPDQHNDEETLKPGLGGRHGGAITKKNVPYTRGGDKGTSQLLTGERRSKADDAFEAMGTVDELCSVVGVAHAELTERGRDYGELTLYLLEIMSRLFDIGSHVAKPKKTYDSDSDDEGFSADGVGGGFDYHHIEDMEDWIDSYTEALPELTSFILPTGSKSAAQLHVARTVCRRAERRVVPLVQAGVCDPNALKYLNRLSDFFFTAARYINFVEDQAEVLYCLPQKDATQRNRRARNLKQDYKC